MVALPLLGSVTMTKREIGDAPPAQRKESDNVTTRNTLRPPWKTSQGRQSCPWCRGAMETWCQWENARKGSSCGLARIHSSDGAGRGASIRDV